MPITSMTSTPAATAVDHLAESAAHKAGDTIQAAKQMANDALDSLQSGVDGLRQAAPSALGRAAAQVDALTQRGIERARETTQQLREQAARAGDKTTSYIRDEPMKSVLVAAAAGAVIAALVSWLAHSRSTPRN